MKTLMLLLAASFLAPVAFSGKLGLDSYTIYLNDKLLVRQSVHEPLDLKKLELTEANASDKLVIHYAQCNAPGKIGKNRSITIRGTDGAVVRQWKFPDVQGGDAPMTISVKEVLEIMKTGNGSLVMFYTADGLERGQRLAAIARR